MNLGVIFLLVSGMQAPQCPGSTAPVTVRDAYVEAHLKFIGLQFETDPRAVEQVEFGGCVLKWCTEQTATATQRALAQGELLQAEQNRGLHSEAKAIHTKLAACTVVQPEPKPKPEPKVFQSSANWPARIAGAGAVIAGGLSLWAALRANTVNADVDRLGEAGMSSECDGRTLVACRARWHTLRAEGDDLELTAQVLAGATVLSAGLAVWWFLDPWDSALQPMVETHSLGVAWGGMF